MKHTLFPVDELEPGSVRSVEIDDIPIAVLRTRDGSVHALRDSCPHHRARLSRGRVEHPVVVDETGAISLSDQSVLMCPWHGFEFDVETGGCLADPEKLRVRAYPVTVEDGHVVVER